MRVKSAAVIDRLNTSVVFWFSVYCVQNCVKTEYFDDPINESNLYEAYYIVNFGVTTTDG